KVNGRTMSGQSLENSIPTLVSTWSVNQSGIDLGDGIKADAELSGGITGEVGVGLRNIEYGRQLLEGRMILRQGIASLRTFRSGFGLATAGVASVYQFGGFADFLFLQPTAGREALTTESMQLVQRI